MSDDLDEPHRRVDARAYPALISLFGAHDGVDLGTAWIPTLLKELESSCFDSIRTQTHVGCFLKHFFPFLIGS